MLSIFTDKAFNFFYSPIAAVATANSLNDDVGDYTWAKFIRDGYCENLIFGLCVFILIWIWVPFLIKPTTE